MAPVAMPMTCNPHRCGHHTSAEQRASVLFSKLCVCVCVVIGFASVMLCSAEQISEQIDVHVDPAVRGRSSVVPQRRAVVVEPCDPNSAWQRWTVPPTDTPGRLVLAEGGGCVDWPDVGGSLNQDPLEVSLCGLPTQQRLRHDGGNTEDVATGKQSSIWDKLWILNGTSGEIVAASGRANGELLTGCSANMHSLCSHMTVSAS